MNHAYISCGSVIFQSNFRKLFITSYYRSSHETPFYRKYVLLKSMAWNQHLNLCAVFFCSWSRLHTTRGLVLIQTLISQLSSHLIIQIQYLKTLSNFQTYTFDSKGKQELTVLQYYTTHYDLDLDVAQNHQQREPFLNLL